MAKTETKETILNTAEALFAEHGIGAVSLRKIIGEADVNIASVHYHFGSKDELVREVYRRRLRAVNEERMNMLNGLRAEYDIEPIPIRDLLRAFLAPPLTLGGSKKGGKNFFRLVARAHAETDEVVTTVLFEELKDIVAEFMKEFTKSTPNIAPQERMMRLAFIAGSMVQAVLMPMKPQFMESFAVDDVSHDQLLEMLIAFCAEGVTASGGRGDA